MITPDQIQDVADERDEETREFRIFGPPGTGKTTNLSRQIARAADRFGPDAVLVTSFSRAAAAELAGRDLPISFDRIGTLHSHCFHALGGPEIAEADVEEWNRDNPQWPITPIRKQGKLDGEESGADDTSTLKAGDDALQQLGRYRGMFHGFQPGWNEPLGKFQRAWTEYKRANRLMDFTDLIDTCLRDVPIAPKSPAVIFADEAQDLNRMQLSLIRKWGEHAHYFILAGDDDQTIYTFTGAEPDAFLKPQVPHDHRIILKQSYRLPRAIHHFADSFIQQVTRRQEKEYLPRPAEGEVERLSRDNYCRTEYDVLKTALGHIEQGKTVMFLASCAYMLGPVVRVLRQNGIPYHNPYRRSNGAWNPLRLSKRTTTVGRILSLLVAHPGFGEGHRDWTNEDVALWAEVLQAKGVLRHGMKARLHVADLQETASVNRLYELFEDAACASLMDACDGSVMDLLEWWRMRVPLEVKKRSDFPAEITRRCGPRVLAQTPQVVVGTIHSVKGGEADVVYLFPDLSQAGDADYQRDGGPRNSVVRQFYVGITRAREKLFICGRATNMAVTI